MRSYIAPVDQLRLERDVERLYPCGPRAIAELLADIASRIGGVPAVMETLADCRGLTPAMMPASGGDRFPARVLRIVAKARA